MLDSILVKHAITLFSYTPSTVSLFRKMKAQFGTPFLQTTVIGKHVLQIRFRSDLELSNHNKHKRLM